MENINNIVVNNRASIVYPERKILLDIILTDRALIHSGEILASYELSQDKRKNNELTILIDKEAQQIITIEEVVKRVFNALDNGEFQQTRKNKSILVLNIKN